eukprot:8351211-Alexandrium_andersonii.AAC.1
MAVTRKRKTNTTSKWTTKGMRTRNISLNMTSTMIGKRRKTRAVKHDRLWRWRSICIWSPRRT